MSNEPGDSDRPILGHMNPTNQKSTVVDEERVGQAITVSLPDCLASPNRDIPIGQALITHDGASNGGQSGLVAERAASLMSAIQEVDWSCLTPCIEDQEQCPSLEDVALELAAKRDSNVVEIASYISQVGSVIEPWEWDDQALVPGVLYVLTKGGEDDLDTKMDISIRLFSHYDPETGARAGECGLDMSVGLATAPELFASWMLNSYQQWQQARPGHLERECRWPDHEGIRAFRLEAHRRWEKGDLANPESWAHWLQRAPAGTGIT